jgi:acyl-CoA reductase-like NAD-dependent aldehyde dehydrogenase
MTSVQLTEAQPSAALSSTPTQLLIGGEWRDAASGRTFAVVNPATGEPLTHVAQGDAEDVDAAVRAARRAFTDGPWRRLKPAERQRIVWRIADVMEEHAEELALLETLDVGKPITNTRAADVPLSIEYFRYMSGWATRLDGKSIDVSLPGEWHSYTVREPVGVVGAIIPWNFPLLMAAWKLAPALACGNTIVLKPASETPLTALRLAALIQEAGVPDGVVNVVTGGGSTAGAAIAAHEGVNKITFTGSTEVGKLIVQAAIGNLKRVSLELGGKSPNIVFPDADLDEAVAGSGLAIFYNSGECCTAGSRLYVHKKVFDNVVQGVADYAEKIRVGSPLDAETEMGPVVSERHMQTIQSYLDIGQSEGARALTGGSRIDRTGYFMEPTVLVDTKPDMRVVREEIFGPVLVAQPFQDLDEVAAVANDSPYGLGAGVWTKDLRIAHGMARRIESGAIYVNCYQPTDAAMPFGGFKQSGWGREHGEQAVELYTEQKGVFMNLGIGV